MGDEEKGRGFGLEIVLVLYVLALFVLVALDLKGYTLPWWL